MRTGAWHMLVALRFIEVPLCTLSSEEDKLCTASTAHRFVGRLPPLTAAALCNAGSALPGCSGRPTGAVAVNVHAFVWSSVCF